MINNPVLHKELVLRFRARHGSAALLGILVAIALPIGLLYWGMVQWMLVSPTPETAQYAWSLTIGIQYLLICLVAPALATNAISREREQQTWEMLISTRLRPSEIILGKLLARLSGALLLFSLPLPLSVFCWVQADHSGASYYNYVSLAQFVLMYALMAITAVFFATFGLFVSYCFRRTLYAIMASYTCLIGFLGIGTIVLSAMLGEILHNSRWDDQLPLLWINPIWLCRFVFELHANRTTYSPSLSLSFGLLCYIALTLLMLWLMIAGFRRRAYE